VAPGPVVPGVAGEAGPTGSTAVDGVDVVVGDPGVVGALGGCAPSWPDGVEEVDVDDGLDVEDGPDGDPPVDGDDGDPAVDGDDGLEPVDGELPDAGSTRRRRSTSSGENGVDPGAGLDWGRPGSSGVEGVVGVDVMGVSSGVSLASDMAIGRWSNGLAAAARDAAAGAGDADSEMRRDRPKVRLSARRLSPNSSRRPPRPLASCVAAATSAVPVPHLPHSAACPIAYVAASQTPSTNVRHAPPRRWGGSLHGAHWRRANDGAKAGLQAGEATGALGPGTLAAEDGGAAVVSLSAASTSRRRRCTVLLRSCKARVAPSWR